jgi:hypothetical protein
VIGRWRDIADRPDRGRDARDAQTGAPDAWATTDVPDPTPKLRRPAPGRDWPSYQQARLPRAHSLARQQVFEPAVFHVNEVIKVEAWSGITGWRFESSSAHRKPCTAELSRSEPPLPGQRLVPWQHPLRTREECANGSSQLSLRGGLR